MMRVAYLSTYVPKRCGLATYTHHLRQSVQTAPGWQGTDVVVVMTGEQERSHYAHPSLWPLVRDDREAYRKMADKINRSDVSLVSLQHEFGIFGGEAGSYLLDFVRRLQKPLVTTFHTVFEHPEEPYRSIQREIAERSDRIIVMNRKAIEFLQRSFSLPPEKIVFIPHGTPVPVPEKRRQFRHELGWTGRKVLLTFGLLSRGKGIERILQALPAVVRVVPEVLYAIVGQTHPEVKKREGEAYREELRGLIRELGLERHVLMVDKYVDEGELVQYLTACDLYITPYPGMQQITSGTLAYAVGLGRPVLTTPYCYAQDLLEGCEELFVPFADEHLWAEKIIQLLSDALVLKQWEKKMERIGRSMHWPQVGEEHASLFAQLAVAQAPVARGKGGEEVASLSG
ncbi:hypothetical protein BSNK01_16820 [Bacillaceae bacterium]